MSKPLIVAAFANVWEPHRRLEALDREFRALDRIFRSHPVFDLKLIPNATLDAIFEVLTDSDLQNRMVAFHFSGHASAGKLIFEGTATQNTYGDGSSLIRFLGTRSALRFVFLNGCATKPLVVDLFARKIPLVIATKYSIEDPLAAKFSQAFYKEISQKKAIGSAFEAAVGQINTDRQNQRSIIRKTREDIILNPNNQQPDDLAWGLYSLSSEKPEEAFLHHKNQASYPIPPEEILKLSFDQIKNTLSKMIEQDYLESAIETLEQIVKEGYDLKQTLLILKGDLYRMRQKEDKNLLSHLEMERSFRQYRQRLLQFIDLLSNDYR